jgi:hypothetical protein
LIMYIITIILLAVEILLEFRVLKATIRLFRFVKSSRRKRRRGTI